MEDVLDILASSASKVTSIPTEPPPTTDYGPKQNSFRGLIVLLTHERLTVPRFPCTHAPRHLFAHLFLTLLRSRAYATAALYTGLTGFPCLHCVYAFPLRFYAVYGRSALQAKLILLSLLAASAAGTACRAPSTVAAGSSCSLDAANRVPAYDVWLRLGGYGVP